MTTNENITVVLKAGTKAFVETSIVEPTDRIETVLAADTVAEVFAMDNEWHIYLVGTSLYYVPASEDK